MVVVNDQNMLGVIMIQDSGGYLSTIVTQKELELTIGVGQDLKHLKLQRMLDTFKLKWKLATLVLEMMKRLELNDQLMMEVL